MALSLQEQLLKAGVADKGKAKQARAEKRKKNKQKKPQVDQAKLAAEQALAEKKAKDRALNEQQNAKLQARSIAAQVKQLITMNKQERSKGDVVLNFTHDNKIKRIYVTEALHKGVIAGKLAVVSLDEEYELVPLPVADKIAERSADTVVYIAEQGSADNASESTSEEDDWYADYEIPDDLTW